jgi:hypothetical protein
VKKRGGRVFVVRGRAPSGSRLKVRLLRGKKIVRARGIQAGPRSRFKTRFRVKKAGRYRGVVKTRIDGTKTRVRTKPRRVKR